MALKTVVDIKQIFYGDPMTSVLVPANGLTGAEVKDFLDGNVKEIVNVHGTTFTYEEGEPSTTDYNNQLNGETYFRDYTPAAKSINFSIGQYDYATKAELQGGEATATSWKSPKNQGIIYKTFVAITKDDTYIVFPKAIVNARAGMVEDKVIGLLFSASPIATGINGLETECWFDASEIV
jgi:hypothetical protein